ncbi:MAG: hypothetical protein H6Q15_2055 [Bacteroidetes bacterium]|nr:hypothetical protein [Bacteroidota bacterium]
MKKFFLLIIISLVQVANINAQNSIEIFNKANLNYKNNDYELALNNYKQIEKKGEISKDLYLNIGNTYFRLKDYSNSILYYERGLRIDPNNEELNTNLLVAKSRLKGDIYVLPDFFLVRFWHNISNLFLPSIWAYITLIFLFITCVVFVIYYFSVETKVFMFFTLLFFFILSLTSFFAGYTRDKYLHDNSYAIVMRNDVFGKDSPDTKSMDKIHLFNGQKIKILSHEDNWVKIRIEDGKEAWILKENLVVI